MYEEIYRLPHGVTLITDLDSIILKKKSRPDISLNEYCVDHEILGGRFVNIQYRYMALLSQDETGTVHGHLFDTFCIDLKTFKFYPGYAREYLGLFIIEDTNSETLSPDDNIVVFPSLKARKPLVFEPDLSIASGNNPFRSAGNNRFYMTFLDHEGKVSLIIWFNIKTRRIWKKHP
jgi:hypothetical protein